MQGDMMSVTILLLAIRAGGGPEQAAGRMRRVGVGGGAVPGHRAELVLHSVLRGPLGLRRRSPGALRRVGL